MKYVKNFLRSDEGVTAIEYALIATLIALVIVASVTALGTTLANMFTRITASI